MKVTAYSLDFAVAELPDGKTFIATANLGGFTLRGNACPDALQAVRSLFHSISGANGAVGTDADLALALALGGTTLQDVAATATTHQITDTASKSKSRG